MAMPPQFGDRMQVDTASDQSSSSLSPPPSTPHNHDTIQVAARSFAHPQLSGEGVANPGSANSAQPSHAANSAAHAQNGNASTHVAANANGSVPEKPKRQRKKKEVGPDGKPVDDGKPKEKKPRKPREPKDKTAGSTTAAPRKKQKLEDKPTHDVPAISRQPTLTEMVNGFHQPMQATTAPLPPQPQHRPSLGLPTSNPPTPRPITSGQNYDPIRGYDPVRAANLETAQQRPANTSNGAASAQASPHVNRASASPSIASLIDPPMPASKMSVPATAYSPQTSMQQPPFVPSQPRSPTPARHTPAAFPHPPRPKSPPPVSMGKVAVIPAIDGAMDIDLTCEAPKPTAEIKKAPSKSSSSAPTPKAVKPTPPVAPAGTGSGLLSSSDLFGGPSSNGTSERKGVNIDIQIPLNPRGGNAINIAQEIAKKYGRDAINPRAAAHRAQLLQIAAAANKLEGGSADDMSVDLMSDMGDDSNVEMGGMEDEKSGTGADGAEKKKGTRRKKVEEYDKEDDFIDDTELAWQEQAAVAKDGFFVYSGPLVPPGEAANVESSAPTRGGRGGRGRGGGRGSRGGATAAGSTGTTHASLAADKTRDPNAPTRARGRGRGTGAPRKPRITKADRERMEAEKADRERAGQHIGGPTGAPIALAPTPATTAANVAQQQQSYGGPQGTMA